MLEAKFQSVLKGECGRIGFPFEYSVEKRVLMLDVPRQLSR
jgi:hypothetical protein